MNIIKEEIKNLVDPVTAPRLPFRHHLRRGISATRLRDLTASALALLLAFEATPTPAYASPVAGLGDDLAGIMGLTDAGRDSSGDGQDVTAESVSVRFLPNAPDGMQAMGEMEPCRLSADGTERDLPENGFSVDGYEFAGWSTTRTGADDGLTGIRAVHVPDGQRLLGLDFDEEVTTTERDATGNDIQVTHSEPRSLAEAVRDGRVLLYAQWQATPDDRGHGTGIGASVTRRGGLEAVVIEGGEGATAEEIAEAIAEDESVTPANAARMSRRVTEAPVVARNADPPADMPSEGDGSNVTNVSLSWVTEDTIDNEDDSLLYVQPGNDLPQEVTMLLKYALSGEHDYGAGDIVITMPATMFAYRDGSVAGKLTIPYPEDPKTTDDFNWSLVGNTCVLTNTRRMSAATTGYIELQFSDLTPHQLVDMRESDEFWAHIEVVTHAGNLIGKTSNTLTAQFDTEESVRAATKYCYDVSWVPADEIDSDLKNPDETEYVVVSWYMYAYVYGNTDFTLSSVDTKADGYQGFVLSPTQSAAGTYADSLNFSGYTSGSPDGTTGTALGYQTVQVAYPASQFEPDTPYTFRNQVVYTLTETDPATPTDERKVSHATASAAYPWSWHMPEFETPQGHLMVNKIGNDGASGRNQGAYWAHPYSTYWTPTQDTYVHNSDDWYGIYPSALNDIQDSQDIEVAYTVESIGYLLPWTNDGNPRVLSDYGKRPVRMETYDTDDTLGSPIWLEGGTSLTRGADYEYKAVEFPAAPQIGAAEAINLNDDGEIRFMHAGDGTVSYIQDYTTSNIPPVTLEAKIDGTWQAVATASWNTGTFQLSSPTGNPILGNRVLLSPSTEQIRTTVTSTNAYIWYYIRPIITIKHDGALGDMLPELFAPGGVTNHTPQIGLFNSAYMRAYDSDNVQLVDIHKNAMDSLRGYSTNVMANPSKTVRQDVSDVDYDRRLITMHYSAKVEEQSYVPDVVTYDQAIEDGRITPEEEGIWYDLLPKGVNPVLSTVRLRNGDVIRDAYAIRNYKGSGRTLLVVEADLAPSPVAYRDDSRIWRYMDVPSISFDAAYGFDSIIDYGSSIHNVIAFESLSRDPIGNVANHGGEPDEPTSSNNVRTADAFVSEDEINAMRGLDPSRTGNRFVYAGVSHNLKALSAARTSLSKDIMVHNDDKGWSKGTYEDKRTVYEGGVYSYRLRMMSDADTISKDLVIYDSLENFHAGEGNDPADVVDESRRWHGTLMGVDLSQLESKGIAPVLYYSTVPNLVLAVDNSPDNMVNIDLTDDSIWLSESEFQARNMNIADVKAVAVDCTQATDGSPFQLQPKESISIVMDMRAPADPVSRPLIAADAHAYNNIFLGCTSIDARTGVERRSGFIRYDYTKVGLMEHSLSVTKEWDDDGNRDGIRPSSVTVRLYANRQDSGRYVTLSEENSWHDEFDNIPYTDREGQEISYSVVEDPVDGYQTSVIREPAGFAIRNRHDPERRNISGRKTWVGGEDAIPSQIYVILRANGTFVEQRRVTPTPDGSWLYAFDNLYARQDGVPIDYRVEEYAVPQAIWKSETDGFDITNTYHPYGDLRIRKTAIGQTDVSASDKFRFSIELEDSTGNLLPGKFQCVIGDGTTSAAPVLVGNGDVIELGNGEHALIREIPNGTSYRITEERKPGYTIDYSSQTSGEIVGNTTTQAFVTNRYRASGTVSLQARKRLTGRALQRYQFRAEVRDADGAIIRTATNRVDGGNASEGDFLFGALYYTAEDDGHEYSYTIQETVRDMAGYVFDTTTYGVTVSVADNGDGTLSTSVVYKDADGTPMQNGVPTFTNAYHASGTLRLKAWKSLEGRPLQDQEFSFELVDGLGNILGTAKNDASGEIVFDALEYDENDINETYGYVVREVPGADATVNYSTQVCGYQVHVSDNGDGTLSFTQDSVSATPVIKRLSWDEVPESKRPYAIWNLDGTDLFIVRDDPYLEQDGEFFGITNADIDTHQYALNRYPLIYAAQSWLPYNEQYDRDDIWPPYIQRYNLTDSGQEKLGRLGVTSSSVTFYAFSETSLNSGETNLVVYGRFTKDDVHAIVEGYDVDATSPSVPAITNTLKPGSLRIEKHVDEVPTGHENDVFRFRVKLTGDKVSEDSTVTYTHGPLVSSNPVLGAVGWLGDRLADLLGPRTAYAETARSLDGTAYVVVSPEGDMVFLRSTETCEAGPNQTVTDIAGNTYTGFVYAGNFETSGGREWSNSCDYHAAIRSVTVADGSLIRPNGGMVAWFSGMPNLTSFSFDGFDLSLCTDLSTMFAGSGITSLSASADTFSNITNMASMCAGCSALTSVDFSGCDFGSLYNASAMFASCSGLETASFANCDLSSLTNPSGMFSGSGVKSIDLSGATCNCISQVRNLGSYNETAYGIFEGASDLETVNLAGASLDTGTSLRSMFAGKTKLKSVNLSNLQHAGGMCNYMFAGCTALESVDMSGFGSPSIEKSQFVSMFASCSALTNVNLQGAHFDSIGSLETMFVGCASLSEIDLMSTIWDTTSTGYCWSANSMLSGCSSLESVEFPDGMYFGSAYSMFGGCSSLEQVTMRNVRCSGSMAGFCSGCVKLESLDMSGLNSSGTVEGFLSGAGTSSENGLAVDLSDSTFTVGINMYFGSSGTTTLDLSGADMSAIQAYPTACACRTLQSLDLSNAKLSARCDSLFCGCTALTDVNLDGLDCAATTSMYYMFGGDSSLTSIDLSKLKNTSGVVSMQDIINGTKVEFVDIHGLDLSGLQRAELFDGTYGTLLEIDAHGIKCPSNMYYWFAYLEKCRRINLSDADTTLVTSAPGMFCGDKVLESLDLSSFDLSNCTSFSGMFNRCDALKSVDLGEKFVFGANDPLPTPPTDYPYDGRWRNASDPDAEPVTAQMLAEIYDGLDEGGSYGRGTYVWATATVQVTFDAGGGTGAMPQDTAYVTYDYEIPESHFVRFDYTQTGWVDQNGNEYGLGGSVPAENLESGLVLTATWEPIEHTLTLGNGTVEVSLAANEFALFDGCLPAGTSYQVYEESPSGWVLVSQSDTSGNIRPMETAVASFTNEYDEGKTSASIVGTKTLDGRMAEEGAFRFELREDGTLIESVMNGAEGNIMFSPITYGEGDVGTHTYTIEEVSGADSTIIYDTHAETVTVEVARSGLNLSAVVTYDADGASFSNSTLPGSLSITKETTGGGDPNQEFEFEVRLRGLTTPISRSSANGTMGLFGFVADAVGHLLSPVVAYADEAWNEYTANGSSIKWRVDGGRLEIAPISGLRGVLRYNANDLGTNAPPWRGNPTYCSGGLAVSVPDGCIIECQGSMAYMFQGDWSNGSITSVDLSQFDFSGATSLMGAFSYSSLSSIDLSNSNLSNVRTMQRMCYGAGSLRSFDMHGVRIPQCQVMEDMLSACSALESVNCSGIVAPAVESLHLFVSSDRKLSSLTFENADLSGTKDGYSTGLNDFATSGTSSDAGERADYNFRNVKFGESLASMFSGVYSNGTVFYFDFSGADTSHVKNARYMFGTNKYIASVDMHGLDLSLCEAMDNAFNNTAGPGYSIDLHDTKFGQTSLNNLFSGACTSNFYGGHVDMRNVDMSRATSAQRMFGGTAFDTIDMRGADLSGVTVPSTTGSSTPHEGMFSVSQSNEHKAAIDLRDCKVGTDLSKLFNGGTGARSIDLRGVDTSAVTDMTDMFSSCISLEEINVDGMDTHRVTSMTRMFYSCMALQELDLTSFDVSSVTDMQYMFVNTPSLQTIYARADADWSVDSRASSDQMFVQSGSLVGGNGTPWSSDATDISMARVDGLDGNPGYFTKGTGDTVVTFGANGGTVLVGETHAVMHHRVSAVSVPLVVRNGHVLTGWNTKADGTGTDYGTPNKITPAMGEMLILYAQWAPEGEAYAYDVIHRQERADAPGTYDVIGRETRHSTTTSGVTVVPNEYYGFATPAPKVTDIATDGSTTVTFDYARNRFDVTLVLDDGTTDTQPFTGGIRQSIKAAPAVAGKRFVGWYDGEDGENGFYADRQEVAFEAATTLYAKYFDEAVTSEVSGLDTVLHVKVRAGETVDIPNIPAGTSYEIQEVNVPAGWSQRGQIRGGSGTIVANDTLQATATNEYVAKGVVSLKAHKRLEGQTAADGQFAFELVDMSDQGRVLETVANGDVDTRRTLPDGDTGNSVANVNFGWAPVAFNDIEVTSPGTYTYQIREKADGNDSTVQYDSHAETVTVQVSDNHDGTLSSVVTYDNDGPRFTNRLADGGLSLSKSVVDETPASQGTQFSFDLSLSDGDGNPIPDATYEATVRAKPVPSGVTPEGNTGSSDFMATSDEVLVIYDANGGHFGEGFAQNLVSYRIQATGNTLSQGIYEDPLPPASDKTFGGWFESPDCTDGTEFQPSSLTEDDETVRVYARWDDSPQESVIAVQVRDGQATVPIHAGEVVTFGSLPANTRYALAEQASPGWTQTDAQGLDGSIRAATTATASATNRYAASGVFGIEATKTTSGIELADGAFSFVLSDAEGAFMARATNDGNGDIEFANLTIDPSWVGQTLTFHVSEEPGNEPNILYDSHVEDVTVSFADDGQGLLTASVTYDGDGCSFHNARWVGLPGTGLHGTDLLVTGVFLSLISLAGMGILHDRRRRQAEREERCSLGDNPASSQER